MTRGVLGTCRNPPPAVAGREGIMLVATYQSVFWLPSLLCILHIPILLTVFLQVDIVSAGRYGSVEQHVVCVQC